MFGLNSCLPEVGVGNTVSNCFHQCPSKNDSAQGTDMYILPIGGVSAPQAQGGLVPTTGLPLLSAHRVQ